MNDAIFTDLVAALDLVVIERLPNGYLTLHGRVPDWFQTLAPGVKASGPVDLNQSTPFIQIFLEEAARFWWNTTEGRLRSGPCAARDDEGREFHFEAIALSVGQRRFLLVERLAGFADTQRVLQIARDQALAEEKAGVRRQVIAKHIDKILSLVQSLGATDASAQPPDVVGRIRRECEGLQKTLSQG